MIADVAHDDEFWNDLPPLPDDYVEKKRRQRCLERRKFRPEQYKALAMVLDQCSHDNEIMNLSLYRVMRKLCKMLRADAPKHFDETKFRDLCGF